MHAGFFNMLHDPTDHDLAFGIGDDVDVDFNRMVEEAIEQHRGVVRHFDRVANVATEICIGVHHFHRPSAQHIAWTHHQRIADFAGQGQRLVGIARGPIGWLPQTELFDHLLKPLAVFGQIDRVR